MIISSRKTIGDNIATRLITVVPCLRPSTRFLFKNEFRKTDRRSMIGRTSPMKESVELVICWQFVGQEDIHSEALRNWIRIGLPFHRGAPQSG